MKLIFQLFGCFAPALFLTASMLMTGCSSSNDSRSDKMDTALRQKVEAMEKENPDAMINFMGKCSGSITAGMEAELKSAGIKSGSIVKDVFSASGTAESIKKVSNLDFVVYLELARNLEMK